jgi:very-short-patch-repair endonuclease
MTEPEVILWSRLRRLKADGLHFRRQAPFRGYYLDFVCFERRLVIEVDGGHHGDDDQAAHDKVRDAVLRREGFEVLRFWNGAVRQNLDGVMYSILMTLGTGERQGTRGVPHPSEAKPRPPSPQGGGKRL